MTHSGHTEFLTGELIFGRIFVNVVYVKQESRRPGGVHIRTFSVYTIEIWAFTTSTQIHHSGRSAQPSWHCMWQLRMDKGVFAVENFSVMHICLFSGKDDQGVGKDEPFESRVQYR